MHKNTHLVAFLSICILICFFLTEGIIRIGLFSNFFKLTRLRQPGLYAGYSEDDDYWKLYYRWIGEFRPPNPKAIHPILGWSQVWIEKDNPLGLQKESLTLMSSDKTKVLFYGDSYVRGKVPSSKYEIPRYLTDHFQKTSVVDLSCGGYGLDQMFLLFKLTHKKVNNPYVIFGILIDDDLDRSILSVRTGQKPYFVLKDKNLVLAGIPIDRDPAHYFASHPPQIKSYLFRLFFRRFAQRLHLFKAHLEKIKEKKLINAKIIEEIYSECKRENYPLLFAIFHYNPLIATWQEIFLVNKLQELQIPYIDTREFLLTYAQKHNIDLADFYVQRGSERGHHNKLGNEVLSLGMFSHFSKQLGLE